MATMLIVTLTLKNLLRKETTDELKKTNDVIEATLGIKPIWFAPPSQVLIRTLSPMS